MTGIIHVILFDMTRVVYRDILFVFLLKIIGCICFLIIPSEICVAGPLEDPNGQSKELVFATPTNESVFTEHVIEIFKEIAKRTGISCRIVEIPKQRCLEDANRGLYDGVAARVSGVQSSGYANLVQIGVSHISVEYIVFLNSKDIPRAENFKSVVQIARDENLCVAYMRGSVKASRLLAGLTEKNKIPLDSSDQAFKMLGSKRIFAFLAGPGCVSKFFLEKLQKRFPKDDGLQNVTAAFVVSRTLLFPYVHKKYKKMIPAFESALASMKADGTLETLVHTSH